MQVILVLNKLGSIFIWQIFVYFEIAVINSREASELVDL